MARMIDADELEARLERYDVFESIFTETVFDILNEAPTIEPKQEWISVKDRLPEEGVQVLVYWDDGFEIGRYLGGEVGDGVYWMPLPEPPETE